jgi:hypothetical protein
VAGFVIALANGDQLSEFTSEACATGNATQCAEESQGQSGFLDTLRGINPFDFGEGTPTAVAVLWASVVGVLIVGAILSIVFFFVPLTAE